MIDQHACPMVNITGPDGIGSVMMGSPTVMINFMQASRMGDIVIEKPGLALGPANPIILGCPTVIIGEVGMGGAGSPMAGAAAAAKAAATPTYSVSSGKQAKLAHGGTPGQTPGVQTPPPPQAVTMPPAAKKPAAAKDKQIICGIAVNSLHVNCQHGGRVPKDGLLEVVGSAGGGDTITASCGSIGTCGQHPLWEVGGYWTSKTVGTHLSFAARDFKGLTAAKPILPVWLGDASPHVYNVSVASCSGPSYAFVVKDYPSDLQQMKFSTAVYEEKLKKIHDAVEKFLKQLVDHPVFEFPKAAGSCQLQWKEDPKSNRAFYFWQLTLAFDPLLMVGLRLPLGPQAALPAAVRKYCGAGIFLEVKGELALSANGGQLNPPESEKGHFSGKGEGNLYLTILGSVYFGSDADDSPFKVEMGLQSSVGAGGFGLPGRA